MARYILKRVLYMVLVMLIVTTLTFFLVHSIPGDPFSAMIQDLPEETRVLYMEKYGFDQPLIVQYVRFMKQLFSGDLGSSLRYPGRTVAEIAASFAPASRWQSVLWWAPFWASSRRSTATVFRTG